MKVKQLFEAAIPAAYYNPQTKSVMGSVKVNLTPAQWGEIMAALEHTDTWKRITREFDDVTTPRQRKNSAIALRHKGEDQSQFTIWATGQARRTHGTDGSQSSQAQKLKVPHPSATDYVSNYLHAAEAVLKSLSARNAYEAKQVNAVEPDPSMTKVGDFITSPLQNTFFITKCYVDSFEGIPRKCASVHLHCLPEAKPLDFSDCPDEVSSLRVWAKIETITKLPAKAKDISISSENELKMDLTDVLSKIKRCEYLSLPETCSGFMGAYDIKGLQHVSVTSKSGFNRDSSAQRAVDMIEDGLRAKKSKSEVTEELFNAGLKDFI